MATDQSRTGDRVPADAAVVALAEAVAMTDYQTQIQSPTRPSRTSQDVACTRARRISIIVGSAASALIAWTFLDHVSRVDLAVKSGTSINHVGAVAVAVAALLVGFSGWALLTLLEHRAKRPHRTWFTIAIVVFLLSLLGPLGGVGGAAKAALAALHLIVAAFIIVGLPRVGRNVRR